MAGGACDVLTTAARLDGAGGRVTRVVAIGLRAGRHELVVRTVVEA